MLHGTVVPHIDDGDGGVPGRSGLGENQLGECGRRDALQCADGSHDVARYSRISARITEAFAHKQRAAQDSGCPRGDSDNRGAFGVQGSVGETSQPAAANSCRWLAQVLTAAWLLGMGTLSSAQHHNLGWPTLYGPTLPGLWRATVSSCPKHQFFWRHVLVGARLGGDPGHHGRFTRGVEHSTICQPQEHTTLDLSQLQSPIATAASFSRCRGRAGSGSRLGVGCHQNRRPAEPANQPKNDICLRSCASLDLQAQARSARPQDKAKPGATI